MYERRDLEEARRDLKAWLEKWAAKYPKLCEWVETNIEETWTYYRLPLAHHKHLKSTNLLERFNQVCNPFVLYEPVLARRLNGLVVEAHRIEVTALDAGDFGTDQRRAVTVILRAVFGPRIQLFAVYPGDRGRDA